MKPINSPSRLVALQLANGNALFRSAQLLTNVHVHVLVHAFNVLREGGREGIEDGRDCHSISYYHTSPCVHVLQHYSLQSPCTILTPLLPPFIVMMDEKERGMRREISISSPNCLSSPIFE